jgi:hypothetical protein
MSPDMIAGLRALADSLPPGTAIPLPREALLELLGESARSGGAVRSSPLPQELTQREAATLLRVSVSYLRASSCPKHLLPGNGPRGRPLVRYLRDEVLAWATARSLAQHLKRVS